MILRSKLSLRRNIASRYSFFAFLIVANADVAHALTVTSGSGRGISDARANAQLAVERNRNDKAETCGNQGMIYGPAFSGAKDINGCLTDLKVNTTGGITVSGDSTFSDKLTVVNDVTMTGALAVTGTVSAAQPTASNHLATKQYVDTAAASGGGGGGGSSGGVSYIGLTTAAYTGDLGGWVGANTKCASQYGAGARMMTLTDYFAIARTSNFPSQGWINCAGEMTLYNSNTPYCGSVSMGGGDPFYRTACVEWTSANGSYVAASLTVAGRIAYAYCNTPLRIHCVTNGVPPTGDIQAFMGTSGTWNKPAEGTNTTIRCWGGGGGASYAGGGGGGFNTVTIPTNTLPSTVSITVGAGGGGGSVGSSHGGNGGNTTFGGYLTAYGGGGGMGTSPYTGGGGGGAAGVGQHGASGGAGGAGIGGVGKGGNGGNGGSPTAGGGGGGGSPGINGADGNTHHAGGSNGGAGSGGGGGYIGGGSVGARGIGQNGGGDGSPGGEPSSGCGGGGPANVPGGGGAGCNTGTPGAPGGCIITTN